MEIKEENGFEKNYKHFSKKEFHIWDLHNKKLKIAVDINSVLKNKIGLKIKDNLYLIAEEFKIQPSRLFEYFIWKKSFIPLGILLKISKYLKISRYDIESNITHYKQKGVPSLNCVQKPVLPLNISPVFTSILANLFFDGSVPNDGKGTYYNQKDKEIMDDFINKFQVVFGNVYYSNKRDHKGVLKCRIPRIIGEICRNIYNVKSFGTFKSRIPELIFNLDNEHKVAFVITGLIDEGSICFDGSIQFGVSNKCLIEDFQRLCTEIGLKTTKVKKHKNKDHYYIYIKSIKLLNDLYQDLTKKYPVISLRYKQIRLEKSIIIKNKEFFYTKEFAEKRKKLVLLQLNKKENSINELSEKLLINPKTLNRYMFKFIDEGIVDRKKLGNNFIYFLKTH
ncbi:hypothetical protein GOV12_00665 [Candidatus Pacearchaeota archaeon]|nr:hypothetical protein [Candidatus Pacearchaeota archaeon]